MNANFSKPFFSAKINYDFENETNENEFEDEMKDAIKGLSLWYGEFGFGAEYFFDDNFSIGGEFGIRHFNFNYEYIDEYEFVDYNTGQTIILEDTYDFKLRINPTYAKFSLNFYFGRNE